jgi:hypothetical protein
MMLADAVRRPIVVAAANDRGVTFAAIVFVWNP